MNLNNLLQEYKNTIIILEKLFYLLNNNKIIEKKLISHSFHRVLIQYCFFIQNDYLIKLLKKIRKKDILEFSFIKNNYLENKKKWIENTNLLNICNEVIYQLIIDLKINKYSTNEKWIELSKINLNLLSSKFTKKNLNQNIFITKKQIIKKIL